MIFPDDEDGDPAAAAAASAAKESLAGNEEKKWGRPRAWVKGGREGPSVATEPAGLLVFFVNRRFDPSFCGSSLRVGWILTFALTYSTTCIDLKLGLQSPQTTFSWSF